MVLSWGSFPEIVGPLFGGPTGVSSQSHRGLLVPACTGAQGEVGADVLGVGHAEVGVDHVRLFVMAPCSVGVTKGPVRVSEAGVGAGPLVPDVVVDPRWRGRRCGR